MAPTGESNVTLFTHKISPFAQRVQLALVEKGISFKPVYADLFNKPKGLLEANPIYGKVPTLVHDGNSICESLVILEYLEDAWPEKKPLLPKDAVARSKVRFWADYLYKGFANMQKLIQLQPNSPEREAVLAEVPKFFKTVENTMTEYSADGPFFTGDEFGHLDVVLAPLASWAIILKTHVDAPLPGPEQSPRLNKWVDAVKEHKSFKEAIASDDEVLATFNEMMKRRAAAAAAAAAANGK